MPKMTKWKNLKILNLYAGIGGNRKLWGDEVDVTAVEINEEIAQVYQDYFPNDKVVIDDAHEYLLEHFDEFDFIWSSPPCPTHSELMFMCVFSNHETRGNHKKKAKYPAMDLYQEIILLQHFFDGKYCVENVKSYYQPLIAPQKRQRHYFWANFHIPKMQIDKDHIEYGKIKEWEKRYGFDLSGYSFPSDYPKRKVLRNCVHPKIGKVILEAAYSKRQMRLTNLD